MIEQVLNDIRWLFDNRGHEPHDAHRRPGVTQLEHALRTASLAEAAGADDALVTAALLHDLGHMMCQDAEDFHGVDDLHEMRALPLLRSVFDEAVLGPIKLHEEAKRCLCRIEPDYYAALLPEGRRSLTLQGGPLSADEAARFLQEPHAHEAILLRRWDDRACVWEGGRRDLDHFLFIAHRCMAYHGPIGRAPARKAAIVTAPHAAA